MNEQERVIQEVVSQAGHWGVCRRLWGLETFNRMADLIGMAQGKSCQFRNGYFADGVGDKISYFDVFFRDVPDKGGYAVAAGLEPLQHCPSISASAERPLKT